MSIAGGYGMSFKGFHSWMQYGVKKRINVQEPRVYKFDYGKEKNKEIYNSEESPDYDLKNIKVPVDILVGGKDSMFSIAAANDFAKIVNSANQNESVKVHAFPTFYHMTFLVPQPQVKILRNTLDKILDDD